jgi:hypothetical protein
MPHVRGHYRRSGFFSRSHWVRPHYRSRPGTNALLIVAAVLGVLFVLWVLSQAF